MDFLSCKVGNGKTWSLLFDVWTPFGQLISFLGPDAPRIIDLPVDATVSQARSETGWRFTGARCHKTELLLHDHG